MKLKSFKFKPHWLRADPATCISWLVSGALCRYANSARLTDFYRTKNTLNEECGCLCVCVYVYVYVYVCTYAGVCTCVRVCVRLCVSDCSLELL